MARFTNVTALLNGAGFNSAQIQALRELADAILDEVTASAHANTTALDTAFDALVAKLNADTGVNDTDYAGSATAMVTDNATITGLPA